jgi:RNA polymerase sigma-54 factor
MLKLNQSQKQQQKISQQQFLLFKLFELNSQQLEDRIKEELELNPALELAHDSVADMGDFSETNPIDTPTDFAEDASYDGESLGELGLTIEEPFQFESNKEDEDYTANAGTNDFDFNYDDEERDQQVVIADEDSFTSNLIHQLKLYDLSEQELLIGEFIIGNLEEDGYLRRSLDSISDDLAFRQNVIVSEAEIEEVLFLIQNLEPSGIGARNLQECLLIQLHKLPKSRLKTLSIEVIEKHFADFGKRVFSKIQKKLKIEEDEMKQIVEYIAALNPKPGQQLNKSSNLGLYIIPDFFVYRQNDQLILELHQYNQPDLRINEDFIQMLKLHRQEKEKLRLKKDKDTLLFLKDKVEYANWFISAIKQRHEAMILVMKQILDIQHDFFMTGDESNIKPLILRTIAEHINIDISTVSRITNSKYVQTQFGIFSLKFFFSESHNNEDGEEISTRKIKTQLKELIETENPAKPYTDDELTSLLKEKGFNIARRTTAKYREQLNIQPKYLRILQNKQ